LLCNTFVIEFAILFYMRVFCIVALAFFFSLGFSQEPELSQEPQLENPSDTISYEPPVELRDEGSSYSSDDASVKAAAKDATAKGGASDELGWRDWTRLAAFTLAIASGIGAAVKNSDAGKFKKDIKGELENYARKEKIYDYVPGTDATKDAKRDWYIKEYNTQKEGLEKGERYRNIFGISAGVFALTGVVTLFF